MRAATGICAVLAVGLALAAGADDESLGTFRDWSAMRFGQGASRACMAFTRPLKSDGDYARRGDAFVFVTHRPATGERAAVSVEIGYPFEPGSGATLRVGNLGVTLSTRDSTAWLDGRDDAQRLLAAMRRGQEMVVEGTSSRGTRTVDHYSLLGFSAAEAAIDKACPR